MIGQDIPFNDGGRKSIHLIVPHSSLLPAPCSLLPAPCSLLAPASPAAVAAGNVKISRVVRRPRLLSNRRNTEPFGLAGGAPCQPGITGINHLIRANGREEDLDAYSQRETMAGNLLIVETPGGGGYDAS